MTSINTNLYNVAFNQFIKLFISSTTNVTQLKTHNKRVPIQITVVRSQTKSYLKYFFQKKVCMYEICI